MVDVDYNKYPVHFFWSGEQFLQDLWMRSVGVKNPWGEPVTKASYHELVEEEWSHEFEAWINKHDIFLPPDLKKYMQNRMVMGSMRYGRISRAEINFKVEPEINKRLLRYNDTENLEFVVDALNYCMLTYMKNEPGARDRVIRHAEICLNMWRAGKIAGHEVIPIDDGEHTEEE